MKIYSYTLIHTFLIALFIVATSSNCFAEFKPEVFEVKTSDGNGLVLINSNC